MKARIFVLTSIIFVLCHVATDAKNKNKLPTNNDVSAAERELKQFYESYADDLRSHRKQAIANRNDSRAYFS